MLSLIAALLISSAGADTLHCEATSDTFYYSTSADSLVGIGKGNLWGAWTAVDTVQSWSYCVLPLIFAGEHEVEAVIFARDGRILVPPDTTREATPDELYVALKRWTQEQAASCGKTDPGSLHYQLR